jgi:DNA-binding transcriptional LysR family regulator
MESILMMVAAEEGVSILPNYVTEKLENADNLIFVPMEGDGETVEVIAAWKKEEKNPVLQRFTRFIESSFII